MLPDQVSNPRPLTYESGALPIALRGPAKFCCLGFFMLKVSQNCTSQNCLSVTSILHFFNYKTEFFFPFPFKTIPKS